MPSVWARLDTHSFYQDLSAEACSIFVDQSQVFASIKDIEAVNTARQGSKRKRKGSVQLNNASKKSNRSPSPGGEDLDAIDMDLYGSNNDDADEDKTMSEVNNSSKINQVQDEDSDMDEDDLYMSAPLQVVPQSDELIDELNVSNLGGLAADLESTWWCQLYLTDGSIAVSMLILTSTEQSML